jgi:hypothetical protein
MNDRIALRCPDCAARLRASAALLGRVCPCPRCKQRVVVQRAAPSDADILLVADDRAGSPRAPSAAGGR